MNRKKAAGAALAPMYYGQVQWHRLVDWLLEDGVIDAAEHARIIERCSKAESAQAALVRLEAVGV